jgi:hypothetical protein
MDFSPKKGQNQVKNSSVSFEKIIRIVFTNHQDDFRKPSASFWSENFAAKGIKKPQRKSLGLTNCRGQLIQSVPRPLFGNAMFSRGS